MLAALAIGGQVQSAGAGSIVEYRAEYEVRYKGRRVANAEFSVTAAGDDRYIFESVTRARGVWRLASPNPAIEISELVLRDGRIEPVRFDYQDGSRKGEDNYSVEFDASAGEVRIEQAGMSRTIALEPGLLDRGSLQVALMLDLGDCRIPETYRYVDEDGPESYRYERLDDAEIETGTGSYHTIGLSQHREGSSRNTILRLAPALGYLPVRMEQIRDGEAETVFTLDAVSAIEPAGAACSGLR